MAGLSGSQFQGWQTKHHLKGHMNMCIMWITYIIYSCLGIETNVKMLTDGHVDIYMDNWTSLIYKP